jgi:acyl-CoA synthetase (AMP-forming)/AMP-acid ligase II
MYGITETTVHVTYRALSRADVAHDGGSVIGRAIPDLAVYVLDACASPVPIGVAGELCVGGAGLARGYLNLPGLTAERFVANPFRKGERLYRSGDLVRMLPNGDLQYVGRMDCQVKVRGFRIELGEIESLLAQHPEVREAVVLSEQDGANEADRLAAYVVAEAGAAPEPAQLRAFLGKHLPDYMLPAAFALLDVLPLTPNGKLDRKALASRQVQVAHSRADTTPTTATEDVVASIWSGSSRPRAGWHPREFLRARRSFAARHPSDVSVA